VSHSLSGDEPSPVVDAQVLEILPRDALLSLTKRRSNLDRQTYPQRKLHVPPHERLRPRIRKGICVER